MWYLGIDTKLYEAMFIIIADFRLILKVKTFEVLVEVVEETLIAAFMPSLRLLFIIMNDLY